MEIRTYTPFSDTPQNLYPEMPAVFQAMDGSLPIGSLALFAPGPDRAEVTASVLPSRRREHVFSRLLCAAEEVLRSYGYREALLLSSSPEGHAVAAHWGLPLSHCVYRMFWSGALPSSALNVELYPASEEAFSALALLWGRSFPGPLSQGTAQLRSVLSHCLCFRLDGALAGLLCVQPGPVPELCGLAVTPELRGRGAGRAALSALLRRLSALPEHPPVALSVDSRNKPALALYRRCGFTVRSETGYYRRFLSGSNSECGR